MNVLSRDLACQEAVELVTDYLEGSLPRRQRRRFEKHLSACDNCATYLEQIRVTIRLSGRVEPHQLDPETRQGLLELYKRYQS